MTETTTAPVSDVAQLERLKVLHNGTKGTLTFTDTEMERRLTGLRTIMAEKDLDAVILTSGSVEIHNPKTVRSTVGSLFHLPIVTGVGLADAVAHVKSLGLQVLAADGGGGELDLLAAAGELAQPTAWIMGNEAWGLPAADAELADRVVAVPMWGAAESLNLSSAAAICLYQTASAQRRGKTDQRSAHVRCP